MAGELTIKLKIKRSVALVSDLHVGSPWAPWPRGFRTPQGVPVPPSPGQEQLLEYWRDFQAQCNRLKVDMVICLGDMIDGGNRKGHGPGANRMTADLNLQVDAARILLEPLVEGRKLYGVSGSPYHDSRDAKLEKMLLESLGGKFWGLARNLKLKGTNRVLNLAHGVSGALIYRATKADRELLFILAAEAARKIDFHVDLFVRGHLHYYGYLEQEANAFLQLPGWCDWIPYKFSLNLLGRQPDIGGVILTVDTENRMHVWPFTYPLPRISSGLEEEA